MTKPFVDLVIACHDPSRPLERAVRSVLAGETARRQVRVTVVAHGQPAGVFTEVLDGVPGEWRVVEYSDGLSSPAGPFNDGLARAEAPYCAVMGSDDFLEPGAMDEWIRRAEHSDADMVIAPVRIDGQPVMLNPLPRLQRTRRLDAARDRLLYRTAPLGLIRTATMRRLGLTMTEGMRTGEDIEFGARLLTQSERIDFPFRAPCYVIGTDARQRTSHSVLSLAETLRPLSLLLDTDVPAIMSAAHRRAFAIKFLRISVLGAARARPTTSDWQDGDAAALQEMMLRLIALSPGVLAPFSRQERVITDAIGHSPTPQGICEGIARSEGLRSRRERMLPRALRSALDRETILRRYLIYAFRERGLG